MASSNATNPPVPTVGDDRFGPIPVDLPQGAELVVENDTEIYYVVDLESDVPVPTNTKIPVASNLDSVSEPIKSLLKPSDIVQTYWNLAYEVSLWNRNQGKTHRSTMGDGSGDTHLMVTSTILNLIIPVFTPRFNTTMYLILAEQTSGRVDSPIILRRRNAQTGAYVGSDYSLTRTGTKLILPNDIMFLANEQALIVAAVNVTLSLTFRSRPLISATDLRDFANGLAESEMNIAETPLNQKILIETDFTN